MKFSEKIIQARKAKALTQEDLAEAVGVSRQAVSKWETEEAKPDLEKLVAICKVLDLSMDYLCLDKQPVETEVHQTEPACRKKQNTRISVCVGVIAAILVGLLVFGLCGGFQSKNQSGEVSSESYADLLDKLKVADARHETPYTGQWRILFTPSIQVPGMEIQIAVRDNLIGSTYYYDATQSGAGYYIDYKRPDYEYNYDFIAICTIGDVTVQFPLINMEGEGGRYHHDYIWTKR